jgi:hypothetical protein
MTVVVALVLGGSAMARDTRGESAVDAARDLGEHWSAEPGFAGVVWDADTDTAGLFWNGPVPAEVSATVEAAAAQGVHVVVKPAQFSAAELAQEAQRLSDTVPYVRTVSPRADGSGLDVGVTLAALSDAQERGIDLATTLSPYPLSVSDSDPAPA